MIIANTFPKSGTGLLRQVLQPFGKDHGHFGMFAPITNQRHEQHSVVNFLLRMAGAERGYITAHLHWHPDYEKAIFPKHKMIMLIRDPREIVVSHVKYVRATRNHPLHNIFMTMDEDVCQIVSMRGIEDNPNFPNLADRFLPYLGWCYGKRFDPNVLVIGYHELAAMPELACRKIASHIYPVPPPDAEDFGVLVGKMLMGIDPKKSPTYRPGDHKKWEKEMTPEAQEYFVEHFQWLLILMNSLMYVG